MKHQQRTVGAIVKIPLNNAYHTYARLLEVQTAFYDCRTKQNLSVEEIVKSPVLFVVMIYSDIITKGIWQKIGKKLPIESHLIELSKQPKYKQDIFTKKYYIIESGVDKEITKEEAKELESLAVWDYKDIEERLNDYYDKHVNHYTHYSQNSNLSKTFLQEPPTKYNSENKDD